jgi:hypothetical protein
LFQFVRVEPSAAKVSPMDAKHGSQPFGEDQLAPGDILDGSVVLKRAEELFDPVPGLTGGFGKSVN